MTTEPHPDETPTYGRPDPDRNLAVRNAMGEHVRALCVLAGVEDHYQDVISVTLDHRGLTVEYTDREASITLGSHHVSKTVTVMGPVRYAASVEEFPRIDQYRHLSPTEHRFTGKREWGISPGLDRPCQVCGVQLQDHP